MTCAARRSWRRHACAASGTWRASETNARCNHSRLGWCGTAACSPASMPSQPRPGRAPHRPGATHCLCKHNTSRAPTLLGCGALHTRRTWPHTMRVHKSILALARSTSAPARLPAHEGAVVRQRHHTHGCVYCTKQARCQHNQVPAITAIPLRECATHTSPCQRMTSSARPHVRYAAPQYHNNVCTHAPQHRLA